MSFLDMTRWDNPDAVWLLMVPVLVLAMFFAYMGFRKRIMASIPGKKLFARMAPGVSTPRLVMYWLGMVVVMALIVVALMRPRYGLKDVAVPGAGVDVAVVVDVSRSMLAKDVVPDRLRGAIVQVDRLLNRMRGDRVTLVPFAGLAYVQTPLTVDYEVVKEYLASLRITDMPVQGTAIGRALKTAQRALGLSRKRRAGKYKGSLYKAIVLITDGENFEGDPMEVAKELAKQKVRVFTVGVGTPAGRPVPSLDKDGKVIGSQKQKDGKTPVFSKLNEKLLKNIAATTGGEYFSYAGGDVSAPIYKHLQELEKIEYVHRVRSLLEDRFQYPLGLAIILLMLMLVFPLRKRGAMVAILLLTLSGGSARAQGFLQKAQPMVKKAADLYAKGKYGEALKEIIKAQKKLPPSSSLAYDKGLIEAKNEKFDEAVKDFDFAVAHLEKRDPKILGRLYFAKGTALIMKAQSLQKKKKDRKDVIAAFRKAVDALTESLKHNPNDKNARYNLEVAVTGGYPPCSSMDDNQEDNDSQQQAKFVKLDPKKGQATMNLYICPDDPDYFKLPLNAGETLVVNAMPAKKGGIAPKFTLEGSETRPASNQAMVTTKQDGTVFVHVLPKGAPEDGRPYKLMVQVIPPCPNGDDKFEDNDSLDTAKPLKKGKNMMRACPNDPDYFAVPVPKDKGQDITVTVPKGQGPLNVTLYDAQANEIQPKHVKSKQGEVFAFHLNKLKGKDRKFLLDVHGDNDAQGFYEVKIGKGKGGKNNKNKKNKKNKNKNKKDKKQQKQKKKEQKKQAVEQLMKQLDKNPDNIQAKDALKRFKIRNYRPQKDW